MDGLHKSKLQDSVQLQSVLVLYDQETVRDNGQPSYARLKTSVSLHPKEGRSNGFKTEDRQFDPDLLVFVVEET